MEADAGVQGPRGQVRKHDQVSGGGHARLLIAGYPRKDSGLIVHSWHGMEWHARLGVREMGGRTL